MDNRDMYIYNVEELGNTTDLLGVSALILALKNWQYDGTFGEYDRCRFVSPSGEYILVDRDQVKAAAAELGIDLDSIEEERMER